MEKEHTSKIEQNVPSRKPPLIHGFMDFIRQQGVIGLAVGFILGGAVTKVVASLVNDIINPIVGILLGAAGSLKDMYLQVGPARILWGSFINTIIDFLIIASIVYFAIKGIGLDKIDKEKPAKK